MAARIALKRVGLAVKGLSIEDMGIVEVNAAFGPVPLIAAKELGVRDDQLNPFGSAVA